MVDKWYSEAPEGLSGVSVLSEVGVHGHFHVQPNYSVEVVLWLCCVVVGVVSIIQSEFFDVNYI